MTPRNLTSIEGWDSSRLLNALREGNRPVVIDVALSGPMIPGAVHFARAGLAFDDEQQDKAYAERFLNMLRAAAPDPNQPVVFYCGGAQSWLSVNAAMRAQKLGYTQVKWYRGGLEAWARHGLATVDRLPVAVVH